MERTPHRVGLYFAIVQVFFTLTWTVYVIFLPKLAAQAGIPKTAVAYILLADQLIFVVTDFAMGVMADRMTRVVGRIGHVVLGVTLFSCAAFLLLPFVAPQGVVWPFVAVTALWTASSSALRAPPLMLLGKYAPQPSVPWLSALSLFGLGLASAISPYLTIVLRDTDPRIPFVLSSAALACATLGIVWAERTLAKSPEAARPSPPPAATRPTPWMVSFFVAILCLGIGFQIHFSLNSAPLFLRLTTPDRLPYLMPVFWIGFNLLMLPASLATKRYGGVVVASAGALVAAAASVGAYNAGDLNSLVAMQFLAGGGWGCVLMSTISAALAIGHTGYEGKLTGGVFSLLAVASVARIVVLTSELNKDPDFAGLLGWLPTVAWAAAGVLLLLLLPRQRAGLPARGASA
jgi:hypothetical protein